MMISAVAFALVFISVNGAPPTARPSAKPTAPTRAPTTSAPTVPAGPPTIKEYLNYLMYPLNSTACTGPHFIQSNLIDSCFYHAAVSAYAIWSSSGIKTDGALITTEYSYADQACTILTSTEIVSFTTVCTPGSYWNYRYAYQSGHEPHTPYLAGIRTDTYVGYKNCLQSDHNDIVYSYYKPHNTCVNRQLFSNCTNGVGYNLRQYTDAQCKTLSFAKSYTLSACSIAPTLNNQYIQAACFAPGNGYVPIQSAGGHGKGGFGVPRKAENGVHWTPSTGN